MEDNYKGYKGLSKKDERKFYKDNEKPDGYNDIQLTNRFLDTKFYQKFKNDPNIDNLLKESSEYRRQYWNDHYDDSVTKPNAKGTNAVKAENKNPNITTSKIQQSTQQVQQPKQVRRPTPENEQYGINILSMQGGLNLGYDANNNPIGVDLNEGINPLTSKQRAKELADYKTNMMARNANQVPLSPVMSDEDVQKAAKMNLDMMYSTVQKNIYDGLVNQVKDSMGIFGRLVTGAYMNDGIFNKRAKNFADNIMNYPDFAKDYYYDIETGEVFKMNPGSTTNWMNESDRYVNLAKAIKENKAYFEPEKKIDEYTNKQLDERVYYTTEFYKRYRRGVFSKEEFMYQLEVEDALTDYYLGLDENSFKPKYKFDVATGTIVDDVDLSDDVMEDMSLKLQRHKAIEKAKRYAEYAKEEETLYKNVENDAYNEMMAPYKDIKDGERLAMLQVAARKYAKEQAEEAVELNKHVDVTDNTLLGIESPEDLKKYLSFISDVYDTYKNTKEILPEEDVDAMLPELYDDIKDDIKDGKLNMVRRKVDKAVEKIVGANQPLFFSNEYINSKAKALGKDLVTGAVEGGIDNALVIPNTARYLLREAIKPSIDMYGDQDSYITRVWNGIVNDDMAASTHAWANERLQNGPRVYGDRISDHLFGSGYTWGNTGATIASIGFGMSKYGGGKLAQELLEDRYKSKLYKQIAKQTNKELPKNATRNDIVNILKQTDPEITPQNLAIAVDETERYAKALSGKELYTAQTIKASMIEAQVEGLDVRQSILEEGQDKKDEYIQQYATEFAKQLGTVDLEYLLTSPQFEFDKTRATTIINNELEKLGGYNAFMANPNKTYEEKNATLENISRYGIYVAMAENKFDKEVPGYDNHVIKSADAANRAVTITEGATIASIELLGGGIIAKSAPMSTLKNTYKKSKPKSFSKNITGDAGEMKYRIRPKDVIKALKSPISTVAGEVSTELLQGIQSQIATQLGIISAEDYIDGMYNGDGQDEFSGIILNGLDDVDFGKAIFDADLGRTAKATAVSVLAFSGMSPYVSGRRRKVNTAQTKLGKVYDAIYGVMLENPLTEATRDVVEGYRQGRSVVGEINRFYNDPNNKEVLDGVFGISHWSNETVNNIAKDDLSGFENTQTATAFSEALMLSSLDKAPYLQSKVAQLEAIANGTNEQDIIKEWRNVGDSVRQNMSDEDIVKQAKDNAKKMLSLIDKIKTMKTKLDNTYGTEMPYEARVMALYNAVVQDELQSRLKEKNHLIDNVIANIRENPLYEAHKNKVSTGYVSDLENAYEADIENLTKLKEYFSKPVKTTDENGNEVSSDVIFTAEDIMALRTAERSLLLQEGDKFVNKSQKTILDALKKVLTETKVNYRGNEITIEELQKSIISDEINSKHAAAEMNKLFDSPKEVAEKVRKKRNNKLKQKVKELSDHLHRTTNRRAKRWLKNANDIKTLRSSIENIKNNAKDSKDPYSDKNIEDLIKELDKEGYNLMNIYQDMKTLDNALEIALQNIDKIKFDPNIKALLTLVIEKMANDARTLEDFKPESIDDIQLIPDDTSFEMELSENDSRRLRKFILYTTNKAVEKAKNNLNSITEGSTKQSVEEPKQTPTEQKYGVDEADPVNPKPKATYIPIEAKIVVAMNENYEDSNDEKPQGQPTSNEPQQFTEAQVDTTREKKFFIPNVNGTLQEAKESDEYVYTLYLNPNDSTEGELLCTASDQYVLNQRSGISEGVFEVKGDYNNASKVINLKPAKVKLINNIWTVVEKGELGFVKNDISELNEAQPTQPAQQSISEELSKLNEEIGTPSSDSKGMDKIEVGKKITTYEEYDLIDANTYIICSNYLYEKGINEIPIEVMAYSPFTNKVSHHLSSLIFINGKPYIYDMPQSEFIRRTDSGEYEIYAEYKPRLIPYDINIINKEFGVIEESDKAKSFEIYDGQINSPYYKEYLEGSKKAQQPEPQQPAQPAQSAQPEPQKQSKENVIKEMLKFGIDLSKLKGLKIGNYEFDFRTDKYSKDNVIFIIKDLKNNKERLYEFNVAEKIFNDYETTTEDVNIILNIIQHIKTVPEFVININREIYKGENSDIEESIKYFEQVVTNDYIQGNNNLIYEGKTVNKFENNDTANVTFKIRIIGFNDQQSSQSTQSKPQQQLQLSEKEQKHLNKAKANVQQLRDTEAEVDFNNEKQVIERLNLIQRVRIANSKLNNALPQEDIDYIDKETQRIKDNGYELDDLIGKRYDFNSQYREVTFMTDESLPEDSYVISGVNKNQIKRNGVIIQFAEVVVRQNPKDDGKNKLTIESLQSQAVPFNIDKVNDTVKLDVTIDRSPENGMPIQVIKVSSSSNANTSTVSVMRMVDVNGEPTNEFRVSFKYDGLRDPLNPVMKDIYDNVKAMLPEGATVYSINGNEYNKMAVDEIFKGEVPIKTDQPVMDDNGNISNTNVYQISNTPKPNKDAKDDFKPIEEIKKTVDNFETIHKIKKDRNIILAKTQKIINSMFSNFYKLINKVEKRSAIGKDFEKFYNGYKFSPILHKMFPTIESFIEYAKGYMSQSEENMPVSLEEIFTQTYSDYFNPIEFFDTIFGPITVSEKELARDVEEELDNSLLEGEPLNVEEVVVNFIYNFIKGNRKVNYEYDKKNFTDKRLFSKKKADGIKIVTFDKLVEEISEFVREIQDPNGLPVDTDIVKLKSIVESYIKGDKFLSLKEYRKKNIWESKIEEKADSYRDLGIPLARDIFKYIVEGMQRTTKADLKDVFAPAEPEMTPDGDFINIPDEVWNTLSDTEYEDLYSDWIDPSEISKDTHYPEDIVKVVRIKFSEDSKTYSYPIYKNSPILEQLDGFYSIKDSKGIWRRINRHRPSDMISIVDASEYDKLYGKTGFTLKELSKYNEPEIELLDIDKTEQKASISKKKQDISNTSQSNIDSKITPEISEQVKNPDGTYSENTNESQKYALEVLENSGAFRYINDGYVKPNDKFIVIITMENIGGKINPVLWTVTKDEIPNANNGLYEEKFGKHQVLNTIDTTHSRGVDGKFMDTPKGNLIKEIYAFAEANSDKLNEGNGIVYKSKVFTVDKMYPGYIPFNAEGLKDSVEDSITQKNLNLLQKDENGRYGFKNANGFVPVTLRIKDASGEVTYTTNDERINVDSIIETKSFKASNEFSGIMVLIVPILDRFIAAWPVTLLNIIRNGENANISKFVEAATEGAIYDVLSNRIKKFLSDKMKKINDPSIKTTPTSFSDFFRMQKNISSNGNTESHYFEELISYNKELGIFTFGWKRNGSNDWKVQSISAEYKGNDIFNCSIFRDTQGDISYNVEMSRDEMIKYFIKDLLTRPADKGGLDIIDTFLKPNVAKNKPEVLQAMVADGLLYCPTVIPGRMHAEGSYYETDLNGAPKPPQISIDNTPKKPIIPPTASSLVSETANNSMIQPVKNETNTPQLNKSELEKQSEVKISGKKIALKPVSRRKSQKIEPVNPISNVTEQDKVFNEAAIKSYEDAVKYLQEHGKSMPENINSDFWDIMDKDSKKNILNCK